MGRVNGWYVPPTAILIAAFASINSVAASIFTEIQLKGKESSVDETTFLEKQFWLYFYGSLVALAGHLGNDAGFLPHNFIQDIADAKESVQMAVMGGMLSTSLLGMAVANVLRRLDNVVKEYSASVANIATAIVFSLLFPEVFQITLYLVLSLATLCIGITLYERGKPQRTKEVKKLGALDQKVIRQREVRLRLNSRQSQDGTWNGMKYIEDPKRVLLYGSTAIFYSWF